MECKFCGSKLAKGITECPLCGAVAAATDEFLRGDPLVKGLTEKPVSLSSPCPAYSLDRASIIENVECSMIQLLGINGEGISKGTGYFLKHNGKLFCVTNYHVISDSESVVGIFPKKVNPQQERYNLNALAADPLNDLALLSCSADSFGVRPLPKRRVLELENLANVRMGDEVCTVGNPKYLETIYSAGCVSGIGEGDYSRGSLPAANKFLISMNATNGNSGGAVVSFKSGKVLGNITCKDSNMQGFVLCVSAFAIEQLIAAYNER